MPRPEVEVDIQSPMPKGYGFLRKGNVFKTARCRQWTHEDNKTLYVVKQGNKRVGLRAPRYILAKVCNADNKTKADRQSAVQRKDESAQRHFEEAILQQFPAMPREDVESVVMHTLRKRSGRVGRTGQLAMEQKTKLAVAAHIRHRHTSYDGLMTSGLERHRARGKVGAEVARIQRLWQGKSPAVQKDSQPQQRKKKKGNQESQPKTNQLSRNPSQSSKTRSKASPSERQPHSTDSPIVISSGDSRSEHDDDDVDEEDSLWEMSDAMDAFVIDDTSEESSDGLAGA